MLIEMTVVLVIIALVAGGIMLGKVLITQAEIRAVISEYDHYLKAVQEFQDKYHAMPGDMNNATDLWGEADFCGGSGIMENTSPSNIPTCNGNGDGLIARCSDTCGTPSCSMTCSGNDTAEAMLLWHHLSNAGMIRDRYTGNSNGGWAAQVGTNVPASQMRPAGWTLAYRSDFPAHVFLFGGGVSTVWFTSQPILRPPDAFEIDRKLDDGKPTTGDIIAWANHRWPVYRWNESYCYTTTTPRYYVASEVAEDMTYRCSLIFVTGL